MSILLVHYDLPNKHCVSRLLLNIYFAFGFKTLQNILPYLTIYSCVLALKSISIDNTLREKGETIPCKNKIVILVLFVLDALYYHRRVSNGKPLCNQRFQS
jgi:hypothetical protein